MSYFPRSKYRAIRADSELCGRTFASKAEARRGEELKLLEQGGVIKELEYQVSFLLCRKPSIKIKVDFAYKLDGRIFYEDVKGMMTREARVKLAWLDQSQGVKVDIVKP